MSSSRGELRPGIDLADGRALRELMDGLPRLRARREGPVLVDTNLLVYAFRPEQPEHRVARAWLAGLLTDQSGSA